MPSISSIAAQAHHAASSSRPHTFRRAADAQHHIHCCSSLGHLDGTAHISIRDELDAGPSLPHLKEHCSHELPFSAVVSCHSNISMLTGHSHLAQGVCS